MSPSPPRRFSPEPVETTVKSTRRFAPEPIETSRRSRRLTPESVDASVKSTRRFAPEPIETSSRSNRKEAKDDRDPSRSGSDASQSVQQKKGPRKFAPQLVETAKRTRKSVDSGPAIQHHDKTDASPGKHHNDLKGERPGPTPGPPVNTPVSSAVQVPTLRDREKERERELRRLGCPLDSPPHSRSNSHRQPSFRVPDLDTIASSESDISNPPSLSTSPSAVSELSLYMHATRRRESVDERSSGYLLELAAREAEKQLRDQAMAAFPNDEYHERVDHFIGRDSDDESVASENRQSRTTEANRDLLSMRKNHEKLEKEKAHDKKRKEPDATKTPWSNPYSQAQDGKKGAWGDEKELKPMRDSARPPMLGGDIKFPRCRSPDNAKFDVTQAPGAGLESEHLQIPEPEGLWHKEEAHGKPELWSCPHSPESPNGGLWGGFCVGEADHKQPRVPSGLVTPHVEIPDPMATPFSTPARREMPPTPPPSNPDMTSIDEKLLVEKTLEDEFSDAFVTQVYNYLSLGYPSIARAFDHELARISLIPVAELRQDDHLAKAARGYIRLGDDENGPKLGVSEESCARWRALRAYVTQWARQQPQVQDNSAALGGFGVGPRRGSWAI